MGTRYKRIMKQVKIELEQLENEHKSYYYNLTSNERDIHGILIECNQLATDIDNEIALIYNFIRDRYRKRFPELESLIQNPIDYVRAIQAIGKEENLNLVNFDSAIPRSNIMVVTVTASTTIGKPIHKDQICKVLKASRNILDLETDKNKILSLIKKKIISIAPNLSNAIGSTTAANLVCLAGGIIKLSKIPACNIQV